MLLYRDDIEKMLSTTTQYRFILAVMIVLSSVNAAAAAPVHLTVGEGFCNPLGFYDATPVFSWQLSPDGSVQRQSAYQLVAATSADRLPDRADLWDSGRVEPSDTIYVAYQGTPLKSRQRVYWQVRYWDENNRQSRWSETAHFELGLLSKEDWKAKWIQPATQSDPKQEPVAYLMRRFTLNKHVADARLYVTVRCLFELELNGSRVGNDYFANGWTSYHNRLDTLTYDITDQLQKGENTVHAKLGKGWYAG